MAPLFFITILSPPLPLFPISPIPLHSSLFPLSFFDLNPFVPAFPPAPSLIPPLCSSSLFSLSPVAVVVFVVVKVVVLEVVVVVVAVVVIVIVVVVAASLVPHFGRLRIRAPLPL